MNTKKPSSVIQEPQQHHLTSAAIMHAENSQDHVSALKASPIQAKLSIGAVDDPLEAEADAMADKVMRMPDPSFIQRKCSHCEEEEKARLKPGNAFIQKKATDGTQASDAVTSKIQATKGGGNTMNESTKNFMESRFGADFSEVRIHTGEYASSLSKDLNAQAFTVGRDIYFNDGKFSQESFDGKHLLAHELTHVAQQTSLPQFLQKQPAPQPARPRPTLSELVTIANSAINAEYTSAARDGLTDFENIMSSSFDYGAFYMSQLGNVVWAAACFSTGGMAFLISIAGIGIAAASPVASTVTDRVTFHETAAHTIDQIRVLLLNNVTRVTSDIDQQATAQNWDDFTTRRELLLRLLQPEYIEMVAGGLPTVNRSAIAHNIALDLTIKANAFRPSFIGSGGGRFVYDYTVAGHYAEHGFWPFNSVTLNPTSSWRFTRGQTGLYVTQGDEAAFRLIAGEALLQPASMPFAKSVYITSTGEEGLLEIFLNAQNNITSVNTYGVFSNFGVPPPVPASRSVPPPPDTIGAARTLLDNVWSATGRRPPWVRGQDLTRPIFPFRSRATR